MPESKTRFSDSTEQTTDADDAPELTPDLLARLRPMTDAEKAEWRAAQDQLRQGQVRRLRGPQKAPKKEQIAIRLDPDIVAHFRASGPGWHGRINAALRAAMERG